MITICRGFRDQSLREIGAKPAAGEGRESRSSKGRWLCCSSCRGGAVLLCDTVPQANKWKAVVTGRGIHELELLHVALISNVEKLVHD